VAQVVTSTEGKQKREETIIRARGIGGGQTRWVEVTRLNDRVVNLAARGSDLVTLLESRDWLVLWGSGMSDSNAHSPLDVPYLQVGKAGGLFTGNRHLAAPKGTQLADVMLTVAQRYGAEIDRFGLSTRSFAL
jgi:hypothetical protein